MDDPVDIVRCVLCQTDAKLIVLSSKKESIILKLLSLDLQREESEPNLICSECHTMISNFNKFRRRIRKLFKTSVNTSRTVQECEIDSTTEDGDCITSASSAKDVRDKRCATQEKITPENTESITTPLETLISRLQNVRSEVRQEEEQDNVDIPERSTVVCYDNSSSNAEFRRKLRIRCELNKAQKICSICFTICDSMKQLCEHRRTYHPDEDRKSTNKIILNSRCKNCKRKFRDKLSLKAHKCSFKKYQCLNQCGYRFSTEERLKKHFKNCRPGNSIFKCSSCKKVLSNLQSLKLHQSSCIRTNVVVTKLVANAAENNAEKQSLKLHQSNCIRTEVSGTKLAADATENDVEENEEKTSTPTTNGSFKCLKCNEDFNSVAALESHHSTCKGDYSKSFKCLHCGRSFISEKSLQIHSITTHGKRDVESFPESKQPPKAQQNFQIPLKSEPKSDREVNEKTTDLWKQGIKNLSANEWKYETADCTQFVLSESKDSEVMIKEEPAEIIDLSTIVDRNTKNETGCWAEDQLGDNSGDFVTSDTSTSVDQLMTASSIEYSQHYDYRESEYYSSSKKLHKHMHRYHKQEYILPLPYTSYPISKQQSRSNTSRTGGLRDYASRGSRSRSRFHLRGYFFRNGRFLERSKLRGYSSKNGESRDESERAPKHMF